MRRIFLAPAMLLAALPLAAQEADSIPVGTALMSGEVLDVNTGEPIPGVVVAIPELRRSTVTDQWGAFVLDRLPTGTYRWVFQRLGYARWEGESEVADGDLFRVRMLPRTELLEGVTVVLDGFATRRRRIPASVVAVEEAEILASGATHAHQLLVSRGQMTVVSCDGEALACFHWRGATVRPVVFVDDEIFRGGLPQLAMYGAGELHLVEIVKAGAGVRVYVTTRQYAERLARLGRRPPAFAAAGLHPSRGNSFPLQPPP